jgi:hypothetical protein
MRKLKRKKMSSYEHRRLCEIICNKLINEILAEEKTRKKRVKIKS